MVMKNPSSTSSPHFLTPAQQTARKRKQNVLISILCYWFVVGILFVAYARYLAGPRMFLALTIPQSYQLIVMLVVATLITSAFVFRWMRLDQIEHDLKVALVPTLFHALLSVMAFPIHVKETRAPSERWSAFGSYFAMRIAVFSMFIGIYVAYTALIS